MRVSAATHPPAPTQADLRRRQGDSLGAARQAGAPTPASAGSPQLGTSISAPTVIHIEKPFAVVSIGLLAFLRLVLVTRATGGPAVNRADAVGASPAQIYGQDT